MDLTISIALLAALIWKLGDVSKHVTNKDWNALGTQVWIWLLGIIVFLAAGSANAFEALVVPGMVEPLGSLDPWSLVLIGLAVASFGSTLFDFKKAFDGSDSAKTPPLFPPDTHTPGTHN